MIESSHATADLVRESSPATRLGVDLSLLGLATSSLSVPLDPGSTFIRPPCSRVALAPFKARRASGTAMAGLRSCSPF